MQLDPKVLLTIKELPLLAKTVIDGFMSGFNKSNIKGRGWSLASTAATSPAMICDG